MDIILIPGFWLDRSCWDRVVPALEQGGHRVRALTLPGLESVGADRSRVRLRDHVDAVVTAIDESEGGVVLVGHSGGGAIANGAADARPDRVAAELAAMHHVEFIDLPTGHWPQFTKPTQLGQAILAAVDQV